MKWSIQIEKNTMCSELQCKSTQATRDDYDITGEVPNVSYTIQDVSALTRRPDETALVTSGYMLTGTTATRLAQ